MADIDLTNTTSAAPSAVETVSSPMPNRIEAAAPALGGAETTDSSESAAQGDPNFFVQKNAPAAAPSHQSVFHAVMQTIGGGPKTTFEAGPDGKIIRRTENRGYKDLSLSIIGAALTGLFAGAQRKGGGIAALGRGGEAVTEQGLAQDAVKRKQAQEDFQNQQTSMLRAAQVAEANSKTALNTAEAEKYGQEALEKQVTLSRPLLDKAEEQGLITGRNVTQAELDDGIQQGKYDATSVLGPIDGYRTLPNGKLEATHAVLASPETPVSLSQEDWDRYRAAHVKGFESDTKVPAGRMVTLANHGIWTQVAAGHELAMSRLAGVHAALKGTPLEKAIPTNLDAIFAQPGMDEALTRFQRYTSHSGGDVYDALVQMGAEKQDPKTGQMMVSPDAKYANTVAAAFGGWDVLRAYHEKTANASAAAAAKVKTDADIDKETRNGEIDLRHAQAAKARADVQKMKDESDDTGTVQLIVQGKLPLPDVARLLMKKPELVNQIAAADPTFDSNKVKAYAKTYLDFTSGKTSIALNSGGTGMKHLRDLKKINDENPVDVRIPGTKAYNAYKNLQDTVTGELAQFYQLPKTDHSIKSMESTLGATFNRDAAITRQAKSMGEKFDSYEQEWRNAAPSAAYQAAMPNVDAGAKAARAALDPSYKLKQTPSPAGHKVNDVITQGNQQFKVTKVDASGKVLAADPVQQ